jgi:hypothetical protein
MRAIVRFSMSDNRGTEPDRRLLDSGFRRIGTRTYEAETCPKDDLFRTLRGFLDAVETPSRGRLNHLWIYVDEPLGSS